MRRTWRGVLGILASASLALAPGFAAAEAEGGPDPAVDGAKKVGEGVKDTAKDVGRTASEAGARAGRGASDIGDRLHDSAKSFGEALLGGIKLAGRKVIDFFYDDKPPK